MSLLLLMLTVFGPSASAATPWDETLACRPGLFRFAYAGKKIEEPSALCFDQGRSILVSPNCEKGTCEALGAKICALPTPKVASFEGPGLCEALGGFLQEGAFYDGEAWWDMNRCYFAGDRSFADTGVLAARRAQCFKK
jgi:hypothetical protein